MEVVFANGSWREKGRRRRVESNGVPIVPLTWNRERGGTIREIIIIIIEGIAGQEEGEEQELYRDELYREREGGTSNSWHELPSLDSSGCNLFHAISL